jgi:hypothetical protein
MGRLGGLDHPFGDCRVRGCARPPSTLEGSNENEFLGLMVRTCLSVSCAQAATYNINVSDVSGTYTATGTVTTDGTIGVLTASNITDWNWY